MPSSHPDIVYTTLPSPVGDLFVASGARGLVALCFQPDGSEPARLATLMGHPLRHNPAALVGVARALAAYFAGDPAPLALEVDLSRLGDFDRAVLAATAAIPYGQSRRYGEIARQIGRPGGAQAVGQALGRNPVPIVIPCHRVLAGGGHLGGYSGRGGSETKRALLVLEGALLV